MRREANTNQNVYSRHLWATLSFLRDIAAHSTMRRLVVLGLQLLRAKGSNLACGLLEYGLAHRVQCPCCNWTGLRFRSIFFGSYLRDDCACPQCKSMERHRSYFLYYSGLKGMNDKVILYFAPEPSLYLWLKKQRCKIVLADLFAPLVDVRADLMHLPFKTGVVDMIINHHVLEHVADDSAALDELERVLKLGGQIFIAVPLNEHRTVTWDWGFPDPLKQGHFRDYGVDFTHKLERFEYETLDIPTNLSPEQIRRYGLAEREVLYLCRRRLVERLCQ